MEGAWLQIWPVDFSKRYLGILCTVDILFTFWPVGFYWVTVIWSEWNALSRFMTSGFKQFKNVFMGIMESLDRWRRWRSWLLLDFTSTSGIWNTCVCGFHWFGANSRVKTRDGLSKQFSRIRSCVHSVCNPMLKNKTSSLLTHFVQGKNFETHNRRPVRNVPSLYLLSHGFFWQNRNTCQQQPNWPRFLAWTTYSEACNFFCNSKIWCLVYACEWVGTGMGSLSMGSHSSTPTDPLHKHLYSGLVW